VSQTGTTAFNAESAKIAKAVDWLFVIAGWPTVYSCVNSTYTLAGDLANFTTILPWASPPKSAASETKGRPEEGSQTIGRWSVVLQDKQSSVARRSITDLVSRQAYVLGNAGSGHTTYLTVALTASATTVTVNSTTGFASSGNIYIGQECIHYTGTGATTFTGCTRGYLLTQATAHVGPPTAGYLTLNNNRTRSAQQSGQGAKVYDFLPNVYRRLAYVYKGYQGIASTVSWLPAMGGIITGDAKTKNGGVELSASSMTWETYVRGSRMIADTLTNLQTYPEVYTVFPPLLGGDYNLEIYAPNIGNLANGHYALKVHGEWLGVASAVADGTTVVAGFTYDKYACAVVRGLHGGEPPDHNLTNERSDVGWSNVNFSTATPTGTEPIDLLRDVLMSTDGSGSNGTYDVFESGIGCGVPQGLINLTSFSNIRAGYSWDTNCQMYFLFPEPEPGKKFIEEEILRPFGLYLFTGNDGKINLARPQHPQKYYIGATNRVIKVKVAAGGTTFTATMNVGVYTAQEMATEVARALNATTSNFSCTYDTAAHKFNLQHTGSTWDLIASTDNGWNTLGFTSTHSTIAAGAPGQTADTATGAFSGVTLTENDVWDLEEIDARDMQITSVVFEYDYDWDNDKYRSQREFIDAEAVNLGDVLGAHRYVISSKGLISTGSVHGGGRSSRWNWLTDSGTCDPTIKAPTSTGVDSDTWSQLTALSLLDRYRFPPLKIKFKAKWGAGTDASGNAVGTRLEVADNFQFSYSPRGVIADREVASDKLTSRIFEVVSKADNHQDGHVEITALAHRYVSY
jgi:hypothetical protein